MTQTLQLNSIGSLDKISQGGQGVVYRAPNVKTIFAASMVFKQYKPNVFATLDVAALKAMPEFLESLPYRDGARLISIASWPCRLVEDRGQITGFVMPAIPNDFFIDFRTSKGLSRIPAEFQHLLNPPHVLAMRFDGKVITERQKYELLRQVASALDFLHERGVCVGDISPKNLLFSLSDTASVYFIDCDAMRVRGVSLTQQLETPGWEVPHGEERATRYSDRYKLGLLALRLILGSQDAKDPGLIPAAVPDPLRRVISDTLTKAANQRPSLSEWDLALDEARRTAPNNPSPAPTTFQPPPVRARPSVTTLQPSRSTVVTSPIPVQSQPTPIPSARPGTIPVSNLGTQAKQSSALLWLLVPVGLALLVGVIAWASGRSESNTAASSTSTARSSISSSESSERTTSSRTTSPTQSTKQSPREANPDLFANVMGVKGRDPNQDICDNGWRLNDSYGKTGWATHSVRGSQRTSCQFAANVLNAYWDQNPRPSMERRVIEAPGSVYCNTVAGALCSSDGERFIMTCEGESGSYGDWITCTGGSTARVYIF